MAQNRSSAVMAQRVETHEVWRPIQGWGGYEVSDQGRAWIPPCRKRLEKPGDYPEPTQDSMQLEIT